MTTLLSDDYMDFRMEKLGNDRIPRTIEFYDMQVGPFVRWMEKTHPEVDGFASLKVSHLNGWRSPTWERSRPGAV